MLCLVIPATSVMSLSLEVYDKSGNVLSNGTDIYLSGDSSYSTIMVAEFCVKNISTASVSVKAKKILTTIIPGSSNTFCFAGSCYPSGTYVSGSTAIINPGVKDTTFSGDYRPRGHLGESIITYVFFNVADPNDSAWVVVHFNAISAIIQGLQIYDKSGNALLNGTDTVISGDSSYSTIMVVEFGVKNISTASMSVKAKKIVIDTVPGSTNTFCFDSSCFGRDTYVSTTTAIIAPGVEDTSFSADYRPRGHLGESIMMYVFFNVDDPSDSAWVIVHFKAIYNGIDDEIAAKTEISDPYPNPAIHHTTFNYNFPDNTHARFVLRDILGSDIKEMEIHNSEGKLLVNTSDLKSGIYFYSFFVDDELVLTKKLIVR